MTPYGGFWLRFVAYIIDAVILNIAGSVIGAVFGVGMGMAQLSQDAATGASLGVVGISLVINWLYSAVLESSAWQATVGKKALGLVVTDLSGDRISFARATGRYFAKILSSLILLIGFIMAGLTERKQGLHDMLAGTLVYKSRAPELLRNSAEVFE